MSNWKLECYKCQKKGTFIDAKDILYSKWVILAWKVESGEPLVVCDGCKVEETLIKKKGE